MKTDDLKNDEKKLIEDFIINHMFAQNINLYNIESIQKTTKNYINKIKLNEEDYFQIERNIISKLFTSKTAETKSQINNLVEKFSKAINVTDIELNQDDETCIYFHLPNNQSYLINYDSVENNWYLSLIETRSLNLIEEIYNNKYEEFINYLNNLKSR